MAFPIWPQAWRDNLPTAGQAVANTRVGEMHQTILPAISSVQDAQERSIERLVCSPAAADVDLFEISGGPIVITELVGIVTVEIGAGANDLQIVATPTAPGVGVNFSTAVDIDGDAVGTSITFTDAAVPVLTPTTNGAITQFPRHYWLCPVGDLTATFTADAAGNIVWYMVYKPLSPNSVVTIA